MKKYIVWLTFFFIIILILSFSIKLLKNNNKIFNNVNNKSINEIEQFLLNINSYKAKIDVLIKSNKNENRYRIMQEVKENYEKQVVLEPEEIENMEMIYENGILHINNSKINVSKVFNSYPYMSNNILFFTDFLKEYRKSDLKEIRTEADKIIMAINSRDNRYNKRELKVNKETLKPESLVIKDINNDDKVYILYNEIEINDN